MTEVIRQETFDDMQLAIIEQDSEEWFTAEDIGKALGFSAQGQALLGSSTAPGMSLTDFIAWSN
jgi:prophage antirepressor-like protein